MPPFPRAHYYVGAFLLITLVAFAPSYFLVLPNAPFAHHLHGVTATLWIVLLCTQSWSIHHGLWRVHAWSGRASFLLAPLFTAGGLMVTQVTLLKDTAFNEMFGIRLATADVVATLAFALFYFLALRQRRAPDLHARYMLSTVTLLLGPSLARLFANFVPGFLIRGPEDLPKFGQAIDASFVLALVLILVLIGRDLRNRKPVTPFLMAFVASAMMYGGYRGFGETQAWRAASEAFAALPPTIVTLLGFALGAGAAFAGWTLLHDPKRTAQDGLVPVRP
jgi:hypothetical protein